MWVMGVTSSPSGFHEARDGQHALIERMARSVKKQREEWPWRGGIRSCNNSRTLGRRLIVIGLSEVVLS